MSKVDKLIEQINALSKKKKEQGLSEEETELQQKLRQEYLTWFRQNMRKQLDNIDFEYVDEKPKN